MRIRNDHPEPRLVPSRHVLAQPGEVVDWPNSLPVPDGFTVTSPAKPKSTKRAEPEPATHTQEHD